MKALVLAVARTHGILSGVRVLVRRWILATVFPWHASKDIAAICKLGLFITQAFDLKRKISGLSWCINPHMGYGKETDRNGTQVIYWETPLGIMIYLGEREPYFALGFDLSKKVLSIRQIQGVRGKRPPRELHLWPQLFVQGCVEYAKSAGLKEVRIYRADQSLFYEHPVYLVPEEGQRYEDVLREHQARMRRRYDQTAEEMGFVPKGKRYLRWVNPNYGRSSCREHGYLCPLRRVRLSWF